LCDYFLDEFRDVLRRSVTDCVGGAYAQGRRFGARTGAAVEQSERLARAHLLTYFRACEIADRRVYCVFDAHAPASD
jgi:hypothetical protein